MASRRWTGLGGARDDRFVRSGSARLLLGHTASGRDDALAGEILQCISTGNGRDDALVLCAEPSAAARLGDRFARMGALGIRTCTCRELACEILRTPQASRATGVAFSGDGVRILSAFEADFVTEDLKTLGARPKRLREMLKFFYRGWTELLDEDPEWLFTVEETDTFEFLTSELLYLGAVMEPQLANLATKALRLDDGLRAAFLRRNVFVMDYQNLSRASQLLCQLVAGEALVVAADDSGNAEVHESYPYPGGVEEFALLNPAVCRVELGLEAGDGGACRKTCCWETPQDEVEGVADAVAAKLAAGLDPRDVAVMTLHPWWTQRIACALGERGVPVNAWPGPLRLRGDIRDLERSLPLRVVALLRMVANPRDAVAWRSWFGFGDYLARSNVFTAMRRGKTRTQGVREDLEACGYDLGADLDPLFDQVKGMRGPRLLAYLVQTLAGPDAAVPAVLRPLLSLGPEASASQMVAELDRLQFFGGIPAGEGVAVAPFESLAGSDFAWVYAVGFVNGLFPRAEYFDLTRVSIDKQKKMGEKDARRARAMRGLARDGMTVSSFRYADNLFAERAGIKRTRIFAADDDGAMWCEVSASIYTDVLAGAGR